MRRLLGLITFLLPAISSAQPGAMEPLPEGAIPPAEPMTDPRVLSLARGTRSAAARGDCVGARVLGAQIARLDPAFHAAVIKSDPVITQCRPAARVYSIEATREAEAPYQPARTGTPDLDGGILAGEFLVGGLFTFGGAIGGGLLAYGINQDCNDDDCIARVLLGAFLGGTVMAAVGVNLVGDSDEVDGSLGLAIGGSMLGGLLGIGAVAKMEGEGGSLFLLVAAPTLGAMLGFNVHRTYKPQRVRTQPTYDRRLAVQPTQQIEDGTTFTLAAGSF